MEAHTAHVPQAGALVPAVQATDWLLDAPRAAAVADEVAATDGIRRRLLAVADALAIGVALLAGVRLLGNDRLTLLSLLLIPFTVLVAKVIGLYDRDEVLLRKSALEESSALFQLSTIFALGTWLLSPYLVDGALSRKQVLGLWGLLFLCSVVGRLVARRAGDAICPADRCLLIGEDRATLRIARKLGEGRAHGTAVGRIRPADLLRGEVEHSLRLAIQNLNAHRVVLVPGPDHGAETLELIRCAKSLGVRVSIVPGILEVVGSSVEFDELDGLPLLGVRRFGLSRSSMFVKRAFDVICAAAALVAVAPLMAAIALAVKLGSPGPVLFRQTRVGRDGRHFEILKFRTMVDGADALRAELAPLNEAEGIFKITDDPRITPVGRILRRTSLDELPQILNVLRGEMSVVGPRPLVVDEDARITGFDRRRLNLTPGMTGPWQVLGSARVPLAEMVKIDYLYVAGWTLWADVKLVLRTMPHVVARRGR